MLFSCCHHHALSFLITSRVVPIILPSLLYPVFHSFSQWQLPNEPGNEFGSTLQDAGNCSATSSEHQLVTSYFTAAGNILHLGWWDVKIMQISFIWKTMQWVVTKLIFGAICNPVTCKRYFQEAFWQEFLCCSLISPQGRWGSSITPLPNRKTIWI